VSAGAELPVIRFALPINSENRWSDLLAVLIATDPEPVTQLLGLSVSPGKVQVEREVAADSKNRHDIILRAGNRPVAVIEVKVLSGLGPTQLARYLKASPGAETYVVVFPERLVVETQGAEPWRPVTWEALLDSYVGSSNSWVRTCAMAWRAHLADALPKVDSTTQWNDLTEGEPFVPAMHARAAWVFSNLKPPTGVAHHLYSSAAGASAVVHMSANAAAAGCLVEAEMEERLAVRNIPKFADVKRSPLGPSVRVGLRQNDVITSAGFDWDYLLSMWPLMQATRDDWVQRSARPKSQHDKANHQAMVDKGGPRYLGIGFGEAQARMSGECHFGARFQLPPDITLGAIVTTLDETAQLLLRMARVPPPD
jgi:hypothetical protein